MMRDYDFSHWEGKLPKMSACCMTFGRPDMLGEAVECFLRQDYPGETELIILNDHPEILLEYPDIPSNIMLVNLTERIPTIGEKRNMSTDLSSGDIVMQWDDDDIHLPNRFSAIAEKMTLKHYYKPCTFWYWGGGRVHQKPKRNVAHAMSGYSREFYKTMGGYPPKHSGQDIWFEKAARKVWLVDDELYMAGSLPPNGRQRGRKARQCYDIPDEELYYLYRFGGTGSYHLCVWGPGKGYDESMRWVNKRIAPGTYIIKPHWKLDYVALVQENIEKNKREQVQS
jgi:glycosyltransferase involved in cell wall biosynthesis